MSDARYAPTDPAARLRIVDWAEALAQGAERTLLGIPHAPHPWPVSGAAATGTPLVSNGALGCDLIRVPAGTGFPPHTHAGDHLLICVAGQGTITYRGRVYPTRAGQVYLVAGAEPHAVGAVTDHVILAVGSPHRAVDATDRMAPVAYQAITAAFGTLTCLLCARTAEAPAALHTVDCPHCPCLACCGAPEA